MSDTTEAPVAEQKTHNKPRLGEWLIAAAMLFFFAFGYLAAQDWPFRAALFPQIVSVVGLVLTVLRIVGLVVGTVRGRRTTVAVVPSKTAAAVDEQPKDSSPEAEQVRTAAAAGATAPATHKRSDVEIVDDEAEEDNSLEYVFASAGGRAWTEALVWIVLFFIAFFVLGAFVAVPLFALLYLKFSGKTSWLAAALYAVVSGGIIYAVFRELVFVPLPESVIPFLQF